MIQCLLNKDALQNRMFNIIPGPNAEHFSKRNATAQQQNKRLYSAYHWLVCLTHIINA